MLCFIILLGFLQALLVVQYASAVAQNPSILESNWPSPIAKGGNSCTADVLSLHLIGRVTGNALYAREFLVRSSSVVWSERDASLVVTGVCLKLTNDGGVFADIHPKTGLSACCEAGTSWTTNPVHHLEGKCCSADEEFRFDTAVMTGDCVDVSVKKSLAAPVEDTPQTAIDYDCPDCPKRPTGYPTDRTLPIRYGRCYTVSTVAGDPWARSSLYYYTGGILGEYKEVIFKICNSTTSCNTRSGQYVPKGGNWYQLDLTRVRDLPSAEPSWVGSSGIWLA